MEKYHTNAKNMPKRFLYFGGSLSKLYIMQSVYLKQIRFNGFKFFLLLMQRYHER